MGKGHCPQCGRPITAQTREQIIAADLAPCRPGTRLLVLAPLIRGQKGEYRDLFDDLLKQGFVRARVDGRVVRLSDELRLDRQMRHNIEVVIDRLVAGPKVRPRLAEAVELALRLGEGNLIVAIEGEETKAEGGRAEGGETRTADGGQALPASPFPLSAFRHRPFGPLCLHALQLELRAAQPAVVQLQQPAGDVPRVQRAGTDLHVSIPSG